MSVSASETAGRLRRRRPPAWIWLVVVIAVLAAVGAAAAAARPAPDGGGGRGTAESGAVAALATLEVKGRAPKTGYDRAEFGQRWLDTDHNGCDTRNDILARDLTDLVRSGACTVASGNLRDPYTGAEIMFTRGQDTSGRVQIDHVVALSDAWQKGAQQLTASQRAALANDPLNLLAVSGTANAQKSDGDAATWLPGDKGFRCAYVARQIAVKAAYALWVTPAEHDAMAGVLATCPDEPVPARARATTGDETTPSHAFTNRLD